MRQTKREIIVSDEHLALIVEALGILRLYQQGFADADGRLKLEEVKRLENRMRDRQVRRGRGNVGNYAEKL